MNVRTRSVTALESFDGNWVIGPPRPHQVLYDIPRNSKQRRVPTGNTLHAKSRGHISDTWTESTKLSKVAHESYLKRDAQRGRNEFTTRRLKTNNRRSHSASTTNSSGYISSRENVETPVAHEVILHRSDGDFGFTMRQIPSTMYGSKPISAFRPTSRVPALQRLNCVDPGSVADRVGLKPGDYIIEVNKECVTCSPHPYVVHLIKSSPDALRLKVFAGSEDVFKPPSQSNLPQRSSAARNTANGNSHSTYAVPRSNGVELELPHSNSVPQPLHRTTNGTYHNSNGLSTAERRRPGLPNAVVVPVEPVVANIRLSRVVDRDEVFYKSGRKPRSVDVSSSQSRSTTTSNVQRMPSFTSTVTVMSEPVKNDATRLTLTGETVRRNHQRVTTGGGGSVQGELLAANWTGPSGANDVNPTYDSVRPVTVPFDTDEGYIRLSDVDYVAQAAKEQEQVDFLAMAEKARQMYLRTKSISQTK